MMADKNGFTLLVLCFFGSQSIALNSRHKLVIDHDGGADDAIAITMSLLYEKYFSGPQVIALTTTYGNVNLSQVIINSDRILTLCNRKDIPIYSGANHTLIKEIESDYYFGYDGLGDSGYLPPGPILLGKEHAPVALIELSNKYKGELIVLTLGPLTNIALAAAMDPGFINRLAHLYVGAGQIHSSRYLRPEFNAAMDPESYFIMSKSARADKVTLVPSSQIYSTLNITKDWRKNILGAIQTPIVQALNNYERLSFPKDSEWILTDPVTAAFTLDNQIANELKNTSNSIRLSGHRRGWNTNNFFSSNPNSRLTYSLNIERYKKFLLDVFSAELSP